MSKGSPKILARLPADEKAAFERIAAQLGKTPSEIIRNWVRSLIKRHSKAA